MKILYHQGTATKGGQAVHIEKMIDVPRALGHQVRVVAPGSGEKSGAAAGQTEGSLPIYEVLGNATMGVSMEEKIWIVMPAFNEAEVIANVVAHVRKSYPNLVVIDDCSSDETAEFAMGAGAFVVRHPVNLGQGAALQTGITYALRAGAQLIVTFDSDGQHRVEDIAVLLSTLKQTDADIVVGSRFLGAATNLPRFRRFVLKMAVVFSRITSGVNLSDAHNGLRLLTRSAALRIYIRQNRMAHASEIINQIGRLKLKVAEAPVTIVYTEYSLRKGQKLSNAFNIVTELFIDKISR